MNILYYEFLESAEGSYNGMLGALVRAVREYYNTPADRLEALKPHIHALSHSLQDLDETISREPRNYVSEIIDALTKEQDVYTNFMEELPLAGNAVCQELFQKPFIKEEYSFEYSNARAEHVVEFYGYKNGQTDTAELHVVRETLRAVCYRNGIIFIDSSLK